MLSMHVITLQKNGFVKKSDEQSWLCLFVFLTQYVETVSYPMAESKRSRLVCERSRVQFPALAKNSMFAFLFCSCLFFMCLQNRFLYKSLQIFFAMLIYLVYRTHCNSCDRLLGYQETDLSSLRFVYLTFIRVDFCWIIELAKNIVSSLTFII